MPRMTATTNDMRDINNYKDELAKIRLALEILVDNNMEYPDRTDESSGGSPE